MKIALLGYGKMGKAIESIALNKGDEIGVVIDSNQDWEIKRQQLSECDVAIDFTQPEVAVRNILNCFEMNTPVVSGTTGWHSQLPEITEACNKMNGTLLYASNFSIGVSIFREINQKLATLMNDYNDYTAEITEIHHIQKLDTPSGTAITLANDILEKNKNYLKWTMEDPGLKDLPIKSVREGNVPGTHLITWKSAIDCIEIKHEAYSREGFAKGALLAATWLKGKKGIFTMSDLFKG